jgi:polysaccharide chain length determinant protein (PEP-CTERM system associated)
MDSGVNTLVAKVRWIVRATRHRRWIALSVAWAVALASLILILLTPERFEASSRIYVDTQTVLKPLMVGLAYQPDIDQQVRMLAKTLISRPNVERLVDKPELGLKFKDPKEREETITALISQIRVVAAERGNLYSIAYRDSDPELARKLVENMVGMFVSSGADGKKRDSVDAGQFIADQIKTNEAKLVEAEGRLKEFKVRNFGVSGVSNQDYFARMSVLSDEVTKLRSDLQAAEQSRASYRRELSAEDPQLPPMPPVPGAPNSIPVVDTESQRKLVDDLSRRYTSDHPDLIAARRQLVQLEAQKRQEAASRTKGSAATSPIYQSIRISLAEREAQVASLRSQLSMQTARLEQTRALAGRVPQVEAELAQLNRDYDVIRKNYDQLIARRESASLGVKLDESSQLADFRLIDPPRVSPNAVFPRHLHMGLAALVLSVLAGVGAALMLDLLRPTVDDTKLLEQLSGRPALGTVSMSQTTEGLRLGRQDMIRFGGLAALLIVFQIGWLAWIASRSFFR